MPVRDKFAHAFGGQPDAIFVILDFLRRADDHDRSPLTLRRAPISGSRSLWRTITARPCEVLASFRLLSQVHAQIMQATKNLRQMIDRIDVKLLDLLHRPGPTPAVGPGDAA